MKVDTVRISRYLNEIRKSSSELADLVEKGLLSPESIALKAAKYMLIELAESVSNTLQHILAKEKGIPVSGYIDTIVKGNKHGIISKDLYNKLKPFLDFRNSLVHRYWTIDDTRLISNIIKGYEDFFKFSDEIESYLKRLSSVPQLNGP